MSHTITDLHHKLESASQLRSVVRTMKAVAASNISQYQACVVALDEYSKSVDLGLSACLHQNHLRLSSDSLSQITVGPSKKQAVVAIVFGSDQGLVGQFNDDVVQAAVTQLRAMKPGVKVWAVGQRAYERLAQAGLKPQKYYPTPTSVRGITPLVDNILQGFRLEDIPSQILLFFNQSSRAITYTTVQFRLLPLDNEWLKKSFALAWPSKVKPDVIGLSPLQSVLREYFFIGLFRACGQSLACENAYRLASMQRADKNIDELIQDLTGAFNHLRQSKIDEELFDVISGFESIKS